MENKKNPVTIILIIIIALVLVSNIFLLSLLFRQAPHNSPLINKLASIFSGPGNGPATSSGGPGSSGPGGPAYSSSGPGSSGPGGPGISPRNKEPDFIDDDADDLAAQTLAPGEDVYTMNDPDHIIIGHYEQDGNPDNGPEPISWLVLDHGNQYYLVISEKVLDCQPFNDNNPNAVWEDCTLRQWLNDDFYNAAFSDIEQSQILKVLLENPGNPYYDTDDGNDTEDNVFCLSVEELMHNFSFNTLYDWDNLCQGTDLIADLSEYAKDCTSAVHTNTAWWLRSSGHDDYSVCYVDPLGLAGWKNDMEIDGNTLGVRPAIYIKEHP